MGKTRNDIVDRRDVFWAYDKNTGKRCDTTGPCVCTRTVSWAVYAKDAVGLDREFLRHKFIFEVVGYNDESI